ncbi:Zinc finger protein-like protein [Operophtera brumata]|uniref:Zinc finger protein-like protein n=1 Tax=Operophtera brumata TaxID=104452 RepID=A0A0L7LR83_OPEBR|nr:Zinc finger protein-like protein [Operophtera brumata]
MLAARGPEDDQIKWVLPPYMLASGAREPRASSEVRPTGGARLAGAAFGGGHLTPPSYNTSSAKPLILISYYIRLWGLIVTFKMETLVLIPQELSLALRPGGARGKEASVSVWSSIEIQRGTALYPFQGTIRIDKLHVYSYVPDHDRQKNGTGSKV